MLFSVFLGVVWVYTVLWLSSPITKAVLAALFVVLKQSYAVNLNLQTQFFQSSQSSALL